MNEVIRTDFAELPSPLQSYPVDTAHVWEEYRPILNFPAQNIKLSALRCGVIHTWSPTTRVCEKGLSESILLISGLISGLIVNRTRGSTSVSPLQAARGHLSGARRVVRRVAWAPRFRRVARVIWSPQAA